MTSTNDPNTFYICYASLKRKDCAKLPCVLHIGSMVTSFSRLVQVRQEELTVKYILDAQNNEEGIYAPEAIFLNEEEATNHFAFIKTNMARFCSYKLTGHTEHKAVVEARQ